jgi:hypothetical protein
MSVLHPQDRAELLELLRPPEGFELDQAVGTTYSLDLTTLLVLPIGFTWMDLDGASLEAPTSEPLKVLEAVRSMAKRITVLCQAGQIRAPRKHNRLFALLEGALVQASAPAHEGSLHAKTWALRFVDREGLVRYRFLCLSRNLTFDHSWDTVVALEGEMSQTRTRAFKRSKALHAFYEGLLKCPVQPLAGIHRDRLALVAREIGLVDFEPIEPFTELEFYPMGLGDKPWTPLDRRIDRMLVVSPFVDKRFLTKMVEQAGREWVPEDLVSRPETLNELGSTAVDGTSTWVLNTTPPPDENPQPDSPPELTTEASTPTMDTGLHAKLYLIDAGWNSTLLVGSANATTRAFERNVEFLVGLTGSKSKVGIDAFLDGDGQSPSFRELLQRFTPEPVDEHLAEQQAVGRTLDRWCQQVASLPWEVRVVTDPATGDLMLVVVMSAGTITAPPAGGSAWLTPAGLAHATPFPLDGTQFEGEFPIAGEGEITAYLNVTAKLEAPAGVVYRRFTIPALLTGASAERLSRVVTSVITQNGGMAEWLFLMLGHMAPRASDGEARLSQGTSNSRQVRRGSGAGLFEELARAAVRMPDRLEDAKQALAQLSDQDARDPEIAEIRDLLERLTGGSDAAP